MQYIINGQIILTACVITYFKNNEYIKKLPSPI